MVIYREFRPSPALRSIVERLWWLERPAGPHAEPIPPDGHAEIIVHAGDPFVEQRPDGTRHVQDRVLIAGQMTRAVRLASSGFVRVVGARLQADGAHLLFGTPQSSLTNHIADLRDLHRPLARRLRDDVAGRDEGMDMLHALERALGGIAPPPDRTSAARIAIACANQRRGLVRVPELARHAGVSTRQLERLFGERVGVTPKHYLRIIRFQEVLRTLRGSIDNPESVPSIGAPSIHAPSTTWAEIAASHGYYDQPHFIRDFKAFVGISPSAWRISDESLTAVFSALRRDALHAPQARQAR